MAVKGKPVPVSVPLPQATKAQEDSIIFRGGAPSGVEGAVSATPDLLTDEQKMVIEFIQLKPEAFVVHQIDECRATVRRKEGRKVSRIGWCTEVLLKAIRDNQEKYGIEFSPNATEPAHAEPSPRRRRGSRGEG